MLRSILRRVSRPEKLNILVVGATHERYEQALCKTGHNFFSLKQGKQWNTDYGNIPENYKPIDYIPFYLDFDLILVHTSDQRLQIAHDLKQQLGIPILRHTHTLPQDEGERAHHLMGSHVVDMDTFISNFSMVQWGYGDSERAAFINHGIDTDFWKPQDHIERKPHCLSVVNLWAQRDWACGWNLWNEARQNLPVSVLGDNPGLSRPAPSLEALRDAYAGSQVFLNTSLHSPVPMALLEAMACGCAIVSTDTCMIPEIIRTGIQGMLATAPRALNSFCRYFLDNPERAAEYGRQARYKIVSEYNIAQFVENWDKTFRRTLYT